MGKVLIFQRFSRILSVNGNKATPSIGALTPPRSCASFDISLNIPLTLNTQMRNSLTLILFVLAATLLSGCGQTKVTGKVTFPDGSPLTSGTVMFEDDKHTYTATIKSDGTFNMGMLKDGEGIPPGEYRVAVLAIDPESEFAAQPRFLADLKYASSRTSGITYNIQKKTDVAITVEKPAAQ